MSVRKAIKEEALQGLGVKTSIPYQKLIDLYVLDCVKRKKKLALHWAA